MMWGYLFIVLWLVAGLILSHVMKEALHLQPPGGLALLAYLPEAVVVLLALWALWVVMNRRGAQRRVEGLPNPARSPAEVAFYFKQPARLRVREALLGAMALALQRGIVKVEDGKIVLRGKLEELPEIDRELVEKAVEGPSLLGLGSLYRTARLLYEAHFGKFFKGGSLPGYLSFLLLAAALLPFIMGGRRSFEIESYGGWQGYILIAFAEAGLFFFLITALRRYGLLGIEFAIPKEEVREEMEQWAWLEEMLRQHARMGKVEKAWIPYAYALGLPTELLEKIEQEAGFKEGKTLREWVERLI